MMRLAKVKVTKEESYGYKKPIEILDIDNDSTVNLLQSFILILYSFITINITYTYI